jgi:hypothetical protein
MNYALADMTAGEFEAVLRHNMMDLVFEVSNYNTMPPKEWVDAQIKRIAELNALRPDSPTKKAANS